MICIIHILNWYQQVLTVQCWIVISMCWFYGLNTTFSAFKSITNLNGVFMSNTPQRLKCDYVNKNMILLGKCQLEQHASTFLNRKSLEFSCFMLISRLRKRVEACISKQKLMVNFSTLFTAKEVDSMHFLSISNWKWYDYKTKKRAWNTVQKPTARLV